MDELRGASEKGLSADIQIYGVLKSHFQELLLQQNFRLNFVKK